MYSILMGCLFLCVCLGNQVFSQSFSPEEFAQVRFAHRGGYAYGPENTLETIQYNLRNHQVNAIEVDVTMTSDGQLILFHDENIHRLLRTNTDRKVSEMTLAEIQAIPLRDGSWGAVFVPTLEEVMDSLEVLVDNEGLKFIVELDFKITGGQTQTAVQELVRILEKEEKAMGEKVYDTYFASTFFPDTIKELRKQSERLRIGFAVNNNPDEKKFLARMGVLFSPWLVKRYKADLIEPNMCLVTKGYVRRWKRRGILINAWTASSACEKGYLEQFDIAYTTNCPGGDCIGDTTDMVNPTRWCKSCKESYFSEHELQADNR